MTRVGVLRQMLFLGVMCALSLCLRAAEAVGQTDVIAPARMALLKDQHDLAALEGRQESAVGDAERVQQLAALLLRTGRPDEALRRLGSIASPNLDAQLMMLNILLAEHDYPHAQPLMERLAGQYPQEPRVRTALYGWWTLQGDLARVARTLTERAAAGTTVLEDRFAAADLQLRQLDYEGAYKSFTQLQTAAVEAGARARATAGVGFSLFELQRYDEALRTLQQALALAPGDMGTVTSIADVLLRLGRVDEAIDALRFAVQVSPWNERAHHLLGSGFTRRNYTQLFAAAPASFASGDGLRELERGDRALLVRQVDVARRIYEKVAALHPAWADAQVRLGSLEYAERHFMASRDHYWRAANLSPEYGRVHVGLARALEALRLQIDIHYDQDEAQLRNSAMPAIAQLDRYVINWNSLSARHKKRLALSLQPWARYIPALRLGGATLYVKPTYQLLSQAPYEETLRDQRIDYDSRLWDDVRGEGGHHVVVSTEDVETRISGGYDTVLHEVSHQVHAILSQQWTRRIQTLYAEATRRQAASARAFLSQYAASSVWEYFAEGANSLNNHRRDEYDSREIVFERLQERDPALLALARQIMNDADVRPSYGQALVSRGDDLLSRGKPREADAAYVRALHRDPGNESALIARMHVLAILGRYAEARALLSSSGSAHSHSGAMAAECAEVEWLGGANVAEVIGVLQSVRADIDPDEQYLIDLSHGELAYNIGDFPAARRAFSGVLAYQPDNPQALTGLAAVASSEGKLDDAWKYYDAAVRVRSGDVEVRVLYARDLLLAGELSRARQQIDTALLLDPEDPDALAVRAWQLMLMGETGAALQVAREARRQGPWSTLATIIAGTAAGRAGHAAEAEQILRPLQQRIRDGSPPRYVYRSKSGRYSLAYTLPTVDRELLKTLSVAAGGD